MSLISRGVLLFTLLLCLPGIALRAETPPSPRDIESWTRESERALTAEAERMETLLAEAVAGMRRGGEALEAAWRRSGADAPRTAEEAYGFLDAALGSELKIGGLPFGVQLIRDGQPLAWAGWTVPLGERDEPDAAGPARFALRGYGVYQFLSLLGRFPGDEKIVWMIDLPLARRADPPRGESGLPVLLRPEGELRLEVILPSPRAAADSTATSLLRPLRTAGGTTDTGVRMSWALAPAGDDVCELRLHGPSQGTYARDRADRRRGRTGALLLAATLIAGLLIRRLLLRRFEGGMPLVLRALFITLLLGGLRLLLAWSRLPAILAGEREFWDARLFGIDGVGGLLADPGAFLLTALAALAILLVVLRPYLRPDDGLPARREEPASRSPRHRLLRAADLPLLALGAILPCLGVLAARAFADLVVGNTASRLLFETRLTGPATIGFNIAILFALSFLITLFLVPATSAWRRLPVNRLPRLLSGLAMIVGVALLTDPFTACALALLLPITWKVRRAATRLTGFVYHLFFIVISVALLTEGSVGRARDQHLRRHLADIAHDTEAINLWRPAMMEEVLIDVGRNEELRRALAREGGLEPGLALSLWRRSGLQELGLEGGLEIYDAQGRLQDHFQWGIDLAPMRSFLTKERPDLWRDVQQKHVLRGADDRPMLEGRILLRDGAELLGTVELILADRNMVPALRLLTPPWREYSPLERKIAVPGEEEFLLARVDGDGRVVESSAPTLMPAGTSVAADGEGRWSRRALDGRAFATARFGDKLVGYAERSRLERLLESAQRLFIYLIILLLLFLLDIAFTRVPVVRRYLPPLIGARGFGFQHRLLGAFLLVALAPTLMTGLIADRQLRGQYDQATLRTSLERVTAARYSLENRVRQDAQKVLRSEYVQNFITQEFPVVARDTGSFEDNQIMVFNGADSLVLDESLRNWDAADVDSFLAVMPPERVVYERSGTRLYAGILLPLEISTRRMNSTSTIYYRQLLGDGILRNMTDIIGGDLSLFSGGTLLRSNQPFLYGLGYSAPMLDRGTVSDLLLGDLPYRQDLYRAGDMSFGQASLPLNDALDRPVAVLASLDFSGLTARREAQERSRSVVLGMVSLLVILALGLGGFLAGRVFLPIRRLHLGTRRLADGDLSYRLQPLGRDEIGDLVRSFNAMAGGLQETRKELEERRRYLEGVLENVASGVLILGLSGEVRSVNSAARRLLAVDAGGLEGHDLAQLERDAAWPGVQAGPLFRLLIDNPPQLSTGGRQLRLDAEEGSREFRVASSELPTGRVVVFEDVTELIRSQKLAAWSEMARQVAHEIKNPLTPIKLSTQFMERAWRDRRPNFETIFTESIVIIKEQVEILRRRASEFSLFGRRPAIQLETLDLVAAAREVLAPYTSETFEVRWEGDAAVPVRADAEALRKVLLNLVENAREAMGGSGRLDCDCRLADGRGVLLIRDHGSGIPEETLERLFEPYFSTKTGGTGLGLAISAQAVEEMGGALSLENHPEGGAQARLVLNSEG